MNLFPHGISLAIYDTARAWVALAVAAFLVTFGPRVLWALMELRRKSGGE